MTTPSEGEAMLALADMIDNADVIFIRNCQMFTKFDHENVDTMLSGEEQNLIVAALREKFAPGIHVIRGYRRCDICDQPIKDEPGLYEKPRWWQIWAIGKTFHADCYDRALSPDTPREGER